MTIILPWQEEENPNAKIIMPGEEKPDTKITLITNLTEPPPAQKSALQFPNMETAIVAGKKLATKIRLVTNLTLQEGLFFFWKKKQ